MNTYDLPHRPMAALMTMALALVGLAVGAGEASATDTKDAHRGQHCIINIDRSGSVQSRTCAADQASLERTADAHGSTLLMTIFDGEEWDGASAQIRGNAGGCDAEGYGVPDLGAWFPWDNWNDAIGSIHAFNGCNTLTMYEHVNYGWQLDSASVPGASELQYSLTFSAANNRMSSLWLKHA